MAIFLYLRVYMQKEILFKVVQWIENNIEKKISTGELESISGYSKRHLNNVFLKYTGVAPGQYIRYRKLCRAAYLLRLTKHKIVDIAYLLEFDSPQSFSRAFRKSYHCSPSEYREYVNSLFTFACRTDL